MGSGTITDEQGTMLLSERLRESVGELWQRQKEHPFVVGLGNGSLPQANFQFYICQDALFLDVLTKVFGYAVTRASEPGEMEQLGRFLLDTLLVEADLHHRYGERFGLAPEEMRATEMAPTNYAYTRHLLSIAATGTLAELITAMLPCAWIYAEVGRELAAGQAVAPDHPYADWLNTYASPDFDTVEKWMRTWLDTQTIGIRPEEEARLQHIFLTGTRYEWLFWDMAWKLEQWPA